MSAPLKLRVIESGHSSEFELSGPVEIGRQRTVPGSRDLEPGPFHQERLPDGKWRLIVGWNPETAYLSAQHALLEPLASGKVRVTNVSTHFPLHLSDAPAPLKPGEKAEAMPPFFIQFIRRTIFIQRHAEPETMVGKSQALALQSSTGHGPALLEKLDLVQDDHLLECLRATSRVIQSAVAAGDFLDRAARALVEIADLSWGRVLLREGEEWKVVTEHRGEGAGDFPQLSRSVLAEVAKGNWMYERLPPAGAMSGSLGSLQAVVAAPLRGQDDQVVGALYGEVLQGAGPPANWGKDKLRPLLVEMLAHAVSAGLARREVEAQRAIYQQFFPAELADRLVRDPGLIEEGRNEHVTMLFCDVRGFTAASDRLGPVETFRWISDVLERFSQCAHGEKGVVVDYVGDELTAMWGAPEKQDDHAERALRAALAMLRARKELDGKWRSRLKGETAIGIGVNSGEAMVGNIGSKQKVKYGPLGLTVNVASRIQGMTKHLKCPLLVSRETLEAARATARVPFTSRRVVKVRLAGVQEERDLHEVADPELSDTNHFVQSETALEYLEEGEFPKAARLAGDLLREKKEDGPLKLILFRAAQALLNGGEGFDPVWTPPGK